MPFAPNATPPGRDLPGFVARLLGHAEIVDHHHGQRGGAVGKDKGARVQGTVGSVT